MHKDLYGVPALILPIVASLTILLQLLPYPMSLLQRPLRTSSHALRYSPNLKSRICSTAPNSPAAGGPPTRRALLRPLRGVHPEEDDHPKGATPEPPRRTQEVEASRRQREEHLDDRGAEELRNGAVSRHSSTKPSTWLRSRQNSDRARELGIVAVVVADGDPAGERLVAPSIAA